MQDERSGGSRKDAVLTERMETMGSFDAMFTISFAELQRRSRTPLAVEPADVRQLLALLKTEFSKVAARRSDDEWLAMIDSWRLTGFSDRLLESTYRKRTSFLSAVIFVCVTRRAVSHRDQRAGRQAPAGWHRCHDWQTNRQR